MFTMSLLWNKIWELFAAYHGDCIDVQQNSDVLHLLIPKGGLMVALLSTEEGIIEKKLFGMAIQVLWFPNRDGVINETMTTEMNVNFLIRQSN